MARVWLMAEDDPVIRAILTALMNLWEISPLVFRDGNEAFNWLNAVEQGQFEPPLPEIALLDLRMPGPAGEQIAQRMRTVAATTGIPIVFMTAFQLTEEDRARLEEEVRPSLIINKPLPGFDELRALIQRVISESAPKVDTKQISRKAVAEKLDKKEQNRRHPFKRKEIGPQRSAS